MKSLEKILELDKLGKGNVDIRLWISDDLYIHIKQETEHGAVDCELVIPSNGGIDTLMLSAGLRFIRGSAGQKEKYDKMVEQYAEEIKDAYEKLSDGMRKMYLDAVILAHDADITKLGEVRQDMDNFTAIAKGNVWFMRVTGYIMEFLSLVKLTKPFDEVVQVSSKRYLGWAILAKASKQFAEDLTGFASYLGLQGNRALALDLNRLATFYQNLGVEAEMARKRTERFIGELIADRAIYAGTIRFDNTKNIENMLYQAIYNSALIVPGNLFGVNVR